MRTVLWTLAPAAAIVAGCAAPGAPAPGTPAARAPQRCDTAAAQWAVGKTNTAHHVEEARRRSGALMVRLLRPNQPVTMEFDAERLNLQVDATGRVLAATCG